MGGMGGGMGGMPGGMGGMPGGMGGMGGMPGGMGGGMAGGNAPVWSDNATHDLFGEAGGARQKPKAKSQDVVSYPMTLEALYAGGLKKMRVTRKVHAYPDAARASSSSSAASGLARRPRSNAPSPSKKSMMFS